MLHSGSFLNKIVLNLELINGGIQKLKFDSEKITDDGLIFES